MLGLVAFVGGGVAAIRAPEGETLILVLGSVLAVLGGYLTLAGHRSHLYQSANRLAAWQVDAARPGRIDAG